MDRKSARRKFAAQKHSAALRGIEWKLSFKQWLAWWGEDLDRRGSRADQLVMCRKADRGAYELGNIDKGSPRDNARTRGNMTRLKNTQLAALELQNQLDLSPPVDRECREYTEDEIELHNMFGVRSSRLFRGLYALDKDR